MGGSLNCGTAVPLTSGVGIGYIQHGDGDRQGQVPDLNSPSLAD
jgi:hypothetical protein